MLVLRRRAGESLPIGDDIEIELLELTPQGAKIGIRAPRETVILRKELKITEQQNTRAAQGLASRDLPLGISTILSQKLKNLPPNR